LHWYLQLKTRKQHTKHYTQPKHKRKTEKSLTQLTKQTKPWSGTPFTTSVTILTTLEPSQGPECVEWDIKLLSTYTQITPRICSLKI